jgi:hypothetical protein
MLVSIQLLNHHFYITGGASSFPKSAGPQCRSHQKRGRMEGLLKCIWHRWILYRIWDWQNAQSR